MFWNQLGYYKFFMSKCLLGDPSACFPPFPQFFPSIYAAFLGHFSLSPAFPQLFPSFFRPFPELFPSLSPILPSFQHFTPGFSRFSRAISSPLQSNLPRHPDDRAQDGLCGEGLQWNLDLGRWQDHRAATWRENWSDRGWIWDDLGIIWDDFGMILGWFGDDFGDDLWIILDDFGWLQCLEPAYYCERS